MNNATVKKAKDTSVQIGVEREGETDFRYTAGIALCSIAERRKPLRFLVNGFEVLVESGKGNPPYRFLAAAFFLAGAFFVVALTLVPGVPI